MSMTAGVWYHIALVRISSVLTLFIDGVSKGSESGVSGAIAGTTTYVGGYNSVGDSEYSNCYIDDLCITPGLGRYTANFTPPTVAFGGAGTAFLPLDSPVAPRLRQSAQTLTIMLPSDILPATTAVGHLREYPFFDAYNGGIGLIYGTVKEKNSQANTPLHRRVLLVDEASRMTIRETWSDPVTGAFEFRGVKHDVKYSTVSYDHTGAYRAVIADSQMPELTP